MGEGILESTWVVVKAKGYRNPDHDIEDDVCEEEDQSYGFEAVETKRDWRGQTGLETG